MPRQSTAPGVLARGIHHRKTVDRAGKTHGGYLDPGITELWA